MIVHACFDAIVNITLIRHIKVNTRKYSELFYANKRFIKLIDFDAKKQCDMFCFLFLQFMRKKKIEKH